MAKHHTVQKAYLNQWINPKNNKFFVYVIFKNEIIEKTGSWKGFWEKDFNILDDTENKYLPEKITSIIDFQGISTIKKIDYFFKEELSVKDRSRLAFYVALQYRRTPRFRKEMNAMFDKRIKYISKNSALSFDKVNISKEDILKEVPKTKKEQEAAKKISLMSEKEIEEMLNNVNNVNLDNFHIGLNKSGQSKILLKFSNTAKKIFNFQWIFFIAPKNTSFITSDNPCFVGLHNKFFPGPCSPASRTFFPLNTKICLCINASIGSKKELYLDTSKNLVRDINKMILQNSFESVVARDKEHLKRLIKNYDYKNHKKNRKVVVYKKDKCVMFNLE